jgi:hypothetical protein
VVVDGDVVVDRDGDGDETLSLFDDANPRRDAVHVAAHVAVNGHEDERRKQKTPVSSAGESV